MERLFAYIGRAALMGLAWGAAWLPFGLTGGWLSAGELEPQHFATFFLAVFCGAAFTGLAGIAGGRSRLDDLSPYRAAAWGAAAGAFAGMLPFVIGEAHGAISEYSAARNTLIVALTSLAAAMIASRRRLGALSPIRAAVLAAVASGLLTGVRDWMQATPNGRLQFLPIAAMGVLSVASALSAMLSPPIFRWFQKQNSPHLRQGYGG